MENKPLFYGIIGGTVLILVLIIAIACFHGGSGEGSTEKEEVITTPMDILTTDNTGKALEIQSLLAQEGIEADRTADGSKSKLVLNKYTKSQRDRALLAIVKSGLMDKNIGLEVFDKGDFTSSKEDKRIRLARAINGELSRLIRKIPPIEDASVFISIPDPSIFTSQKKPTTATVQMTIPSGDKLERDKVRAVTNLLMGSIPDLQASNIAITDTNGNVYSSVISAEDDKMSILEENDQYMRNKVMSQLDRLLGKGNYVATVSTYLREAPQETEKIIYNPKNASVASAQKFRESLGDKSQDRGESGAVSSFLPGNLPSTDSNSKKSYSRDAEELQYNSGKTQISEVKKPGMIEEISIAVTMDSGVLPSGMPINDLKELIARAASPKVKADNVMIAFSDISTPTLSSDRPVELPKPEESGNPWWTIAAILGLGLVGGLIFIASKVTGTTEKQQKEIDILLEKTNNQQTQILEAQERAAKAQTMVQEQINAPKVTAQSTPAIETLQKTINEIKEEDLDEREFASHLKSWIESN